MGIRKGLKYSRELCKPFVKVPGMNFYATIGPRGFGKNRKPPTVVGGSANIIHQGLFFFPRLP